jgi:hypothetical protein
VIAYGKGGVLESVRGLEHATPTGVFFPQQTVLDIREAVERFEREETRFSAAACRESALGFGIETFRQRFKEFVDSALNRFSPGRVGDRG